MGAKYKKVECERHVATDQFERVHINTKGALATKAPFANIG
jgi:hypothetical protein